MPDRGESGTTNLNRRRLAYALLPFLITIALFGLGVWYFYQSEEAPLHLKVAAGQPGSEAFELMKAVSEVAQLSHNRLTIEIVPTTGSNDNITLLQKGVADVATVQADAVFPQNLSLVANLYPEFFQLLARPGVNIADFGDVAGKRVALAEQSSGEYRSFWLLANHYGLPAEMLRVTTTQGVDLIKELRDGTVDAVFRVKPPRNRELRLLIEITNLTFVPIVQGAAIHLRYPALNAALLPTGTYRGSPPMPMVDLPTVSLDRLLVARTNAPSDAIRELTAILFEKRRDLSQRTGLAGFIKAPDLEAGTLLPVHDGALSYYDREKPSFLEANSDLIGVLISIAAVLYSFILWIKGRLEEGRKGRIDVYNLELAKLSENIGQSASLNELDEHNGKLYAMLNTVIRDLDEDRVGEEGFHTFAFTWGAVQKAIDDRRQRLQLAQGTRQLH